MKLSKDNEITRLLAGKASALKVLMDGYADTLVLQRKATYLVYPETLYFARRSCPCFAS